MRILTFPDFRKFSLNWFWKIANFNLYNNNMEQSSSESISIFQKALTWRALSFISCFFKKRENPIYSGFNFNFFLNDSFKNGSNLKILVIACIVHFYNCRNKIASGNGSPSWSPCCFLRWDIQVFLQLRSWMIENYPKRRVSINSFGKLSTLNALPILISTEIEF